jgi:hypothetical protein
MAYLAGNCTYRYEASWSISYYCGWLVDGQISCSGNDNLAGCGGGASCSQQVFANNLCGANNETPRRTTGFNGVPGYHILHKFLTSPCACSTLPNTTPCFDGFFLFQGASLRNTQTNTTLAMTCLGYNALNATWTTSILTTRNMYRGNCYLFQVKCYHDYLNNSLFSALGSTNSLWTNACQPCL